MDQCCDWKLNQFPLMCTMMDLQSNQSFSDCFQHPATGNKSNCTRAAGCSIYRSMLPSHRVLTFHSNLHLLAMSLSSWVVSNWTPVPVRVTLSNPVPENSPWADRMLWMLEHHPQSDCHYEEHCKLTSFSRIQFESLRRIFQRRNNLSNRTTCN